MAPPTPVQHSAKELDGIIAFFITEVDEHRRGGPNGTRQPGEALSNLLLGLARQREMLRHLGEGGGTISPIPHTPGTIRPDVHAQQQEEQMRVAQEKSQILQRLRDTMKAETDIYRMQEEEQGDLNKVKSMLDTMSRILEKTPLKAMIDVQFDSFAKTIRDVFQTDLLGPLTERQGALLRFVENTQAVLETQYAKYFSAEEKRYLDEVREKITNRARSFLARRTNAYQMFAKHIGAIKPVAALRSDADRHEALALIKKTNAGLEALSRSNFETGRMLRLEHNEFEKLAEKFAM